MAAVAAPGDREPARAAEEWAAVSLVEKGEVMFVLQVLARVKPEYLEAFREATISNARESRQEPGVARFDVLQQEDDPLRFQLVEVYRTRAATAAHKETPHYRQWIEIVTPMMAEARTRSWWTTVYPEDAAY